MNLNVVERKDGVFKKVFSDRERFYKEVACLNFLSDTILASYVPNVVSARTVSHASYEVELSVIPGRPVSAQSVTEKLISEMGTLLARVNSVKSFGFIGTLNSSLKVSESVAHFDVFLLGQLDKWLGRLANHSCDYAREKDFLCECLVQKSEEIRLLGKPVFCHNDFDFKNIMSNGKSVTGLLDWEFVGSYPMVWELRKIAPVLYWDAPAFGRCFEEGYRSIKPDAEFPNREVVSLLVGIDCIGALGWAYNKDDCVHIAEIERILSASIQQF